MGWLDLTTRPTYWKCFTRSSVVLRSFLPLTLASLGVNKDPLGAGVEAELGSGRDTPAGMAAAPLGGFLPGIAAAWPQPRAWTHVDRGSSPGRAWSGGQRCPWPGLWGGGAAPGAPGRQPLQICAISPSMLLGKSPKTLHRPPPFSRETPFYFGKIWLKRLWLFLLKIIILLLSQFSCLRKLHGSRALVG